MVRPANRWMSSKFKQRPGMKSSKLSFGTEHGETGEEDVHPIGKQSAAVAESAARRGIATRGFPVRLLQEDEERPRYSKEYLDELQSSTPNTPQNVSSLPEHLEEMELDASELEGALVLETSEFAGTQQQSTVMLTEAEIRERKERRARLAQEQDFLSVEEINEDSDGNRRKAKDDTRLAAEDEDMGEGFDDYVEDGGLSLGRRAERERRKRERKQMAELISAAEGHTSDDSSNSDAERRIAYEATQSRAGLDGLRRPRSEAAEEAPRVPPKISPLPSLSECLSRLETTLQEMRDQIQAKSARVEQLERERKEISRREGEVQALLDETGKRYQEAMGRGREALTDSMRPHGPGAELVGERGLESLGGTPREATADEDVSS